MATLYEKTASKLDIASSENLLFTEQQMDTRGVRWGLNVEVRKQPTLCQRISRAFSFAGIGKILLGILAIWAIVSMGLQGSKYVRDHKVIDCGCGSSIEEAIAKGCKYDAMGATWLPDVCRDDELTAEFNSAGPGPNGQWPYWRDYKKTIPMNLDDMAALAGTQQPFYTLWEWHIAHCFFGWRKHMRALDRAANFDVATAYDHIAHCEGVVLWERDQVFYSLVALNGSTFW